MIEDSSQRVRARRPRPENSRRQLEHQRELPDGSAELLARTRGQRGVLSASGVMQLQRTVGNQATHRLLVQRKPADIDATWDLKYDATGTLINKAAPRATSTPRTRVINAQLTDGWVLPNQQLIGGHLFKAAFGGPDNDTNVVPWTKTNEDEFGTVEADYKAKADTDARANAVSNQPFTATVKTKASFADRPDLEVTDTELDKAGWPATDPGREERKTKFKDVAERFSGIPSSVSVAVQGLTAGPVTFAKAGTDIAPAYKKNDAALAPAFTPFRRFKRNATETRKLAMISNWTDFRKAKQKDKADIQVNKKLDHVVTNHPGDFGVTGNSSANLEKLQGILSTFIQDTSHEQIEGVYLLNKVDVLHYVDHATRQWVCTTTSGELVAGWILAQDQYDKLIKQGTVG